MQLTPDFSLDEFLPPKVSPEKVPKEVLENLRLLAQRLQAVRDIILKPIHITSGYRTPEHNQKVGGSVTSLHLKGLAADIVVDGMSPNELQEFLFHWSGGMGSYATFTHLDIGPKRRW